MAGAPKTRAEAEADARESFLRDGNHPNHPGDDDQAVFVVIDRETDDDHARVLGQYSRTVEGDTVEYFDHQGNRQFAPEDCVSVVRATWCASVRSVTEMRVRVSYTIDASDDYRRAINLHYGKPGLATREQVARWQREHGSAEDDNLMHDLEQAHERGEA